MPIAAATPPMVTEDALLRFKPLMVTRVPTGPLVGVKLLITGAGGVTVNELALVPVPVTVVTLIGPDVPPDGTAAVICPSLSTVNEVADVPLNFTVLAPVKPVPLMVILAPTVPAPGAKPDTVGAGPTTKFVPLDPVPVAAVTEIAPVVAPTGTAAVIEVSLQLEIEVAFVAPKATVLVPCGEPKPVPVMTTDVPTGPPSGLKLVTVGAAPTTKLVPLIPVPVAVVTEIAPEIAPAGTGIVIEVSSHAVAPVAVVLLNFTVLVPCEAPKPVPVMVTEVPTGPPDGLKLLTTGAAPTTKLSTLVPVPAAVVTEMVPEEAPAGTATVIDVLLQLVAGAAVVAPKATVLVPWLPPKLVPVMVTEVPTGPPAGLKLVTVGAPTV